MTVLLVRRMAKELASLFYDESDSGRMWADTKEEYHRSQAFRDTYPTLGDYLRGYQRCRADFCPDLDANGDPPIGYFHVEGDDRWWKIDRPGWQYFVEQARQTLVTMLRNPTVSDHEKHVISEALIEENRRATDPNRSEKVLQRRLRS